MVFITGANGLLGSYICRKLISENTAVIALKRKNSDLGLLSDIEHRIKWATGDILDQVKLEEQLKEAETVIHCAAVVSFNGKDADLMHKINVEGTRNIVNLCLKLNNIKRLIHMSSVAALGRSKKSNIIDETNHWENSELNTTYAITKYKAELEVWRGIGEGLNALILNPSVVLGPGNWGKSSSKLFKYIWDVNPFYPVGTMNFIDVRDVADIAYQFLGSSKLGERYILNAGKITYKEVFNKIAYHFEKKPPWLKTTKPILILAYIADKIKSLIPSKRSMLSREAIRLSSKDFTYDNAKIKKVMGLEFKSVDETIAWTCNEYLKRIS